MLSKVILLALSASTYVAALSRDAAVAEQLHVLAKRQSTNGSTTASSTALSDIFGLVTSGCRDECGQAGDSFSACTQLMSQAAIAACACSQQSIGDVRACAACISADKSTSSGNSTAVVNNYNSFVDLCTSEGLATVTGTIRVGQATSTASRSSLPSAPSSIASGVSVPLESRSTYNPSATTTTDTALVPSLVANTATGSAASQAAASNSPTSGASALRTGSIAASLLAVLGASVAFFA